MNEQQLQLAFIQFLAQKTGAKNQLELEAAIQLMGEQGLQAAYQEFILLLQQQQVQAAKFGAKLNYIKSLRGQCPEGYEISYYKVGGTLCKKCMKKQQEMKDGGQVPKDPIDEFKCGRKMKKAQGGAVDFEKCGGKTKKTKKKEEGGELNSTKNPKVFSKMALAKCGAKLKEACKGIKMHLKGYPLKETDKKGKTKTTYYKDEATRDSIAANKYNDLEVLTMKPGSYNKKGTWVPNRKEYKKKVNKKQNGGLFTSPIRRAEAIIGTPKGEVRELPEVTVTAILPARLLPEVTVTALRPRYYWYSDNGDGRWNKNEARSETERRVHTFNLDFFNDQVKGIESVDNSPKFTIPSISNVLRVDLLLGMKLSEGDQPRWRRRYNRAGKGSFLDFFTSPVRRKARILKRHGVEGVI